MTSVMRWLAVGICPVVSAVAVRAQDVSENLTPSTLPRPGYEAGRWRFGNTTISPTVLVESHYDSNVFATSNNTVKDAVFNIAPRIEAKTDGSNLEVLSNVHFNRRLLASATGEDTSTYGVGTEATYTPNGTSTVIAAARYDRDVDGRSEAEADPTLSRPALLDSVTGDIGYSYTGSRIGVAVRASAQRISYLDASQADHDLDSYRGSLRGTWIASPRLQFYTEGYFNRRNARLPVDRYGVDRDASTFGVLGGVAVNIDTRWHGEFGVGAFRFNSDVALPSYTGVALNGELTFSPTRRTQFKLTAFRGDVATVRAGAFNRTDTRVSLRFDQEVRHNLLLRGGFAYYTMDYTGTIRNLRYAIGDVEAEVLLNQVVSVIVSASYLDRGAQNLSDQFSRATAGIGLKFRI